MEPVAGKTGFPVAMLFGQGASISTSAYESLGHFLQEAVPFPLWFGVPQCLLDTAAVPLTLKSGMDRIKVRMTSFSHVRKRRFSSTRARCIVLSTLPLTNVPTVRLVFGWHAQKYHHILRRSFTWRRHDA